MSNKSSSLEVNCPTCKSPVKWNKEAKHRPFCSDRCQKIDLGAWAAEEYGIAAEPSEDWSGSATTEQPSDFTLQ
mgnify:CR=1 FL=1